MTHRSLFLSAKVPAVPDPDAAALEQTSPAVPHAAARGTDSILASGRRVLARYGLRGDSEWKLVPDGSDPTSGSQIYPTSDTARVVMRATEIPLTPGYLVRLDVLALPSGPTQQSDGLGGYELDVALGQVIAYVTYRSPDGLVEHDVEAAIDIPASAAPFAAEPDGAVAAALTRTVVAVPQVVDAGPEQWAEWSAVGVEVDIRVEVVGACRVIDLALVEQPARVVCSLDDAWPSPLYADGLGAAWAQPITSWPQTQISADDKGGGVVALAEGVAAHGDLLGPVLWSWSSGSEGDTLANWLAANEAPAFTSSGTTARHVPTSSSSPGDLPAALTGCQGATLLQSGDDALGRRTGVQPVWIAAYMRISGTGTAYLRVETSDLDSYTLETTSLVFEWVRVAGWLEVGASPEDSREIRAWLDASVGGINGEVRYIQISRRQLPP